MTARAVDLLETLAIVLAAGVLLGAAPRIAALHPDAPLGAALPWGLAVLATLVAAISVAGHFLKGISGAD